MSPPLVSFGRASLLAGACALAAAVSAQALPEGAADGLGEGVLAVVAGETITVEEFEREMVLRGGDIPGQYSTLEQRRALLDQMISRRALVAKARELGYDRDPTVIAALERAMVAKLQQEELDRRLERVSVSDEQVAAYYQAHAADYARPPRSKAAIVFIAVPLMASDEKRTELERRAEQALEEARALAPETTHFGAVARKYSDDRSSRYQGGVIGWLTEYASREYKWDPKVVKAIFSLSEPGQIGPIVQTDEGLYLVRLVEREAARSRPLDQVEDGIRNRLTREERSRLRESFLAQTVADAGVRVNAELLETVEPPTPAGIEAPQDVPPALPPG